MKFISPRSDYSCFASIRDVITDQTFNIQLSNINSALIYVITANGTLHPTIDLPRPIQRVFYLKIRKGQDVQL